MAQQIGQAAQTALATVATNCSQSTKPSTSWEAEHKRAFLRTFRRWAILFKGKDMAVEDEKWLIAEYYRALSFLTEAGFAALTEELVKKNTFFPTIAECMAIANPAKRDYSTVFACHRDQVTTFLRSAPPALPPRALALTHDD